METDQYVLLNQIDGMWFCIDFPSGIEDFEVTAGFDGRWDFTYCATNLVHRLERLYGRKLHLLG